MVLRRIRGIRYHGSILRHQRRPQISGSLWGDGSSPSTHAHHLPLVTTGPRRRLVIAIYTQNNGAPPGHMAAQRDGTSALKLHLNDLARIFSPSSPWIAHHLDPFKTTPSHTSTKRQPPACQQTAASRIFRIKSWIQLRSQSHLKKLV